MKIIKKLILWIISSIIIISVAVGIYGYQYYAETMKKESIESKIQEIRQDYTYVKKEDLPQDYLNAIVAVEDRRFFSHGAIDPIGIARAILINIKNKSFQEGGSTITQQVAKNLYYISETNVGKRKVAEMFTAIEIEKKYSKEEILEIYANTIYFGNGYYGIKEACNGYLKKEPKDMNLAESTMMAGIPNAPSVYAPTANKEYCKSRQRKVLASMVDAGYISKEVADSVDQSFIDKIE